jgi:hypothetical protein
VNSDQFQSDIFTTGTALTFELIKFDA